MSTMLSPNFSSVYEASIVPPIFALPLHTNEINQFEVQLQVFMQILTQFP